MATSEAEKEEIMEAKNASNEEPRDDVLAIDLPAPEGWKKKFTPKKGGTPRRNEIMFISPTGAEIKNKKQLDQYLKSHPGGPSASEFDWGTGDTPRRSSRISEKSKAMETPESEPPKKVQKKSSSKKGGKEKDDIDEEAETAEEKEAAKEDGDHDKGVVDTKTEMGDDGDHDKGAVATEAEMEDVEDVGDHNEGEEAPVDKDNMEDPEQKNKVEVDEMDKEKPESEGVTDGTSAVKEDDAGNKSLQMSDLEQAKPEAPFQLPVPKETAPYQQDAKIADDAVPEEADAKAEKEFNDVKEGQEEELDKETPTEKVDNLEEGESDKSNMKIREGGKPVENHSMSCEEAPHEPKVPQVNS